MKFKRVDFNFTPLKVISGLYVATEVSSRQTYIAASGTYSPDYAKTVTDDKGVVTYVTPLVIKLSARVVDRDGIIPDGPINSSLTNIKFTINDGGTVTTLVTNTDYEVITSGDNAGTVKIKKNLPIGKALELRVTADYVDTRTGQVHKINEYTSLYCGIDNMNENMYLEGGSSVYDPCEYSGKGLSQPHEVAITAYHKCGNISTPVDADKLRFVWHKQRDTGLFTEVGSNTLDYDCVVSGVSNETITIDRRLIGDSLTLRCYALYSPTGGVGDKSIVATTPIETVTIARKMPKYTYECSGLPSDISPTTSHVNPSIILTTPQGSINNEEDLFYYLWYAGANNHTSAVSVTPVAQGKTAEVETKYIVDEHGMMLGYEVQERGAIKAVADSDGAVLVDSDGAVLVC